MKAQQAGLEAAEASVKTARAGHYPTLGLSASYGKAITGLYDPAFIGANKANTSVGAVSYTHLDVYKRQVLSK